MTARDVALAYLRAGLSVIPVQREDKRPYLPWRTYQSRRATRSEVVNWFKRWPEAGVAVVCGVVSGLVVVDCDPRNGDGFQALAHRLPQTPTVETGGGGRHYYFALQPGERISKLPNLLPGVDLQAEASYIVAPPSVHPSGRRYRWLPSLALGEVPLAPLPAVIRQLIALRRRKEEEIQPQRLAFTGPALTLDAVLSSLNGVRQCGSGWIARCPSHEDGEPSLSIGEAQGGQLLLHCFAGCSFAEILAALRRDAA